MSITICDTHLTRTVRYLSLTFEPVYFVASIDLLSLHCPVCGVVGLFILYGHYKRFVITDDTSNDCKINIRVHRIQCTQCRSTHSLLPTNFVPYTQFTYLFIYYIVTLDENDDLITSFDVALQTVRKIKARVIAFWDSLFPVLLQ
jgi:hypothetical protein